MFSGCLIIGRYFVENQENNMPIKKGNIAITGTQGGLCGYFSHDINVFRAASPLTGERVKKDPAFEGFRKSCNRMKEAAPIAAALYNQIPKEKKKFALYRMLTGEVLKMVKQGFDKEYIRETLYPLYIEPVLLQPEIVKRPEMKAASKQSSPFSGQLFIMNSGSAPVYLGRLKGHRRFKVWLMPQR
jgi:hypothetical protein